ncbi:hypothetical protein O3P69_017812 [Scylla paramamosain]|uniref:Basic proline-rich protein-like n=1 Tax=Scylla paramamosain TaxID=85552 RepID=A0AAW0SEI7_SCYPA
MVITRRSVLPQLQQQAALGHCRQLVPCEQHAVISPDAQHKKSQLGAKGALRLPRPDLKGFLPQEEEEEEEEEARVPPRGTRQRRRRALRPAPPGPRAPPHPPSATPVPTTASVPRPTPGAPAPGLPAPPPADTAPSLPCPEGAPLRVTLPLPRHLPRARSPVTRHKSPPRPSPAKDRSPRPRRPQARTRSPPGAGHLPGAAPPCVPAAPTRTGPRHPGHALLPRLSPRGAAAPPTVLPPPCTAVHHRGEPVLLGGGAESPRSCGRLAAPMIFAPAAGPPQHRRKAGGGSPEARRSRWGGKLAMTPPRQAKGARDPSPLRRSPSRSPARPYHHGPHTPERPPDGGRFPASPPDGYSGRGGRHTPEGSPPTDHHQYHSPVGQYRSCISPPFSRSPPWSPGGGRRASPMGWRSPRYQHQHHHHYTPPPHDRWSPQRSPRCATRSPGRRSPPPGHRASPGRGRSPLSRSPRHSPRRCPGLRSPRRSPSPRGEVYPYERRGWGGAAWEWKASQHHSPKAEQGEARYRRGSAGDSAPLKTDADSTISDSELPSAAPPAPPKAAAAAATATAGVQLALPSTTTAVPVPL